MAQQATQILGLIACDRVKERDDDEQWRMSTQRNVKQKCSTCAGQCRSRGGRRMEQSESFGYCKGTFDRSESLEGECGGLLCEFA